MANLAKLTKRCLAPLSCLGVAALALAAGTPQGLGYKGTPTIPGTTWGVHDGDRPQPRIVTPAETFSLGAKPPSDAIMLFDGTDLAKWQTARGDPAPWPVHDGYTETGRGGGIRTRDKWADFQLHLEFATPERVQGTGQGRGNSGVLINGMYEIQILDSFDSKTYPDGQAGAIYGQTPPLVNVSKPPVQCQSYDIFFESPRWNPQKELVKKAAATVIYNGVVLHHRRELLGQTDGVGSVAHLSLGTYPAQPHPPEVFIELQDHSNPVHFRNIWIRTIGEYDGADSAKSL